MTKHQYFAALIVLLTGGLLSGCTSDKSPYSPEEYRQWITKVDQQLKQAAQSNTAKAQWTNSEDFSEPSLMIDIRGFHSARDGQGIADMIADQFLADFPKENRVFIHVYNADSSREIYFKMYDR